MINTQPLFQSMSCDDCYLQRDQVDIWQFSLAYEPDYASGLLNQEEQTRAKRFHFVRHQRRFTVARALTRLILARYLDKTPQALDFSYNQYGKPSVINTQQLEFNLSHSGDLALLAVGQNEALGIDLEFFSARPYQGIADQLFSANEIKGLAQVPAALEPLGFFHIWSQKEAFIKAGGLGLSYPTQDFSVPVVPPTHELIFDALFKQYWQLISFMPVLACCGALCCARSIRTVRKINFALPVNA